MISDGLLALPLTDIKQIRLFVLIRVTRTPKSTINFHFDLESGRMLAKLLDGHVAVHLDTMNKSLDVLG